MINVYQLTDIIEQMDNNLHTKKIKTARFEEGTGAAGPEIIFGKMIANFLWSGY